jgi:hypothetical protein
MFLVQWNNEELIIYLHLLKWQCPTLVGYRSGFSSVKTAIPIHEFNSQIV